MSVSLVAKLEALLFQAGEPILKKRIAPLLKVTVDALGDTVDELNTSLSGRGLALIETPTTLELRTSPEVADVVKEYQESELSKDLGKATLETLAIILYKEGAARGDIDWIRGVNSSTALRSLLLRGLIVRSEHEGDKRKAFYNVTSEALAHLGIRNVKDLPRYGELMKSIEEHKTQEIQEV